MECIDSNILEIIQIILAVILILCIVLEVSTLAVRIANNKKLFEIL